MDSARLKLLEELQVAAGSMVDDMPLSQCVDALIDGVYSNLTRNIGLDPNRAVVADRTHIITEGAIYSLYNGLRLIYHTVNIYSLADQLETLRIQELNNNVEKKEVNRGE